jgi:hypothetical protein
MSDVIRQRLVESIRIKSAMETCPSEMDDAHTHSGVPHQRTPPRKPQLPPVHSGLCSSAAKRRPKPGAEPPRLGPATLCCLHHLPRQHSRRWAASHWDGKVVCNISSFYCVVIFVCIPKISRELHLISLWKTASVVHVL